MQDRSHALAREASNTRLFADAHARADRDPRIDDRPARTTVYAKREAARPLRYALVGGRSSHAKASFYSLTGCDALGLLGSYAGPSSAPRCYSYSRPGLLLCVAHYSTPHTSQRTSGSCTPGVQRGGGKAPPPACRARVHTEHAIHCTCHSFISHSAGASRHALPSGALP